VIPLVLCWILLVCSVQISYMELYMIVIPGRKFTRHSIWCMLLVDFLIFDFLTDVGREQLTCIGVAFWWLHITSDNYSALDFV
jgi:hypothetical protein